MECQPSTNSKDGVTDFITAKSYLHNRESEASEAAKHTHNNVFSPFSLCKGNDAIIYHPVGLLVAQPLSAEGQIVAALVCDGIGKRETS